MRLLTKWPFSCDVADMISIANVTIRIPAIEVAADPMPCEALATNNGANDSAAANTIRINRPLHNNVYTVFIDITLDFFLY